MKTSDSPVRACLRLCYTAAVILLAGCGAGGVSSNGHGLEKAAVLEIPCAQHTDKRLLAMTDDGLGLTTALGLAAGRYALPTTAAPTQLVIMFHGHGNDSCSWRRHLQQSAALGAIAVAMDYTGTRQEPSENYGWPVRAGAADSLAAAKYFLAHYPSIKQVLAFSISMGGNMAGYAVASHDAVRADGSPMFDYWVNVEGVNNLTEEYLIARAISPANAGGKVAVQEIEEENGGALETAPQKYQEITNVARTADMSALKGVILVNGVDDGLVPTNQGPEMAAALTRAQVPAHLYTVLLRAGAEDGTTLTSIPLGPVFSAGGQTYTSPFAGHGWEGSDTQLVIKTGFEQLYALMAGGTVSAGETPVPGM